MSHSEKKLRILNLEDSLEDSESILSELKRLGWEVCFKRVVSREELRRELQNHSWDLVISNHQLVDFSALEAIEIVRNLNSQLPLILVSDSVGEERVVELMRGGVEDMVFKGRLERFLPVVRRVLRENEGREKEVRANRLAHQALAAKEQMLAIVSHDIKNPLFAIQLEAQMLLRAVDRNEKSLFGEEVRIQAGRILKTSERIKSLISDLLDKNKTENSLCTVKKDNIDLLKVLHEVMESLRPIIQQKEIILIREFQIPKMMMNVDRNKMFQVFANLINNAIKFTPNAGTIKIILEETSCDCTFHVVDSGPGVKASEIGHIFDKYWTGADQTDHSGSGLGLFICKTILEAHSGMIFVRNNENGGASFSFNLPKVPGLKEMSFSFYEGHKDDRKKIYIIDDDEDLREVMSWALGKEGFSIHSFRSPKEALECLRKGRHHPHLIVVDFHMDEMKGSDFVLEKENIPTALACPVLMISASPQEIEKNVKRTSYKEIITKPIDLEGLVDNIKKHLV